MGKNKMKRKLKILIFMLIMIMGGGVSGAYCTVYSVLAGCVPDLPAYSGPPLNFTTFGTVEDDTGAPLAVGSPVQYINASGNFIVGPLSNGNVDTGAGESLVKSYTVGDDNKHHGFSNMAGEFYTDLSTITTNVNSFYVRAWNKDPGLGDAKFGESQIFTAMPGSPPSAPSEVSLPTFQVMFSKTAPDTPTNLGVGSILYNTATATFDASFGARYYEISWESGSGPVSTSPPLYNNAQRYPSPNSTDLKSIDMSGLSDDTDYSVRVQAVNSFGPSGWSAAVPFHTQRKPDLTPPQTITDLRIKDSGGSAGSYTVTLEWTAPYDTDRLGAPATVTGYDIRYSPEPILSSTLEGFVDWYLATSVDPSYSTPTPLHWGLTQEVTIAGLPAGIRSFAVKSKDTTPNWSAISNITDLQFGMAGGFTGPSTMESGFSLIAAGQAEPMALDNSNLFESGAATGDAGTADVIYQYEPGTTNFKEAYLSLSGVWIDPNTGSAPTWGIEPDKGYFYMRRKPSSLMWGVRPKP